MQSQREGSEVDVVLHVSFNVNSIEATRFSKTVNYTLRDKKYSAGPAEKQFVISKHRPTEILIHGAQN